MKCANCRTENKNTNIRCEFCGTELNAIEENVDFSNKDYTQANMSQIDLGSKNARCYCNNIYTYKKVVF